MLLALGFRVEALILGFETFFRAVCHAPCKPLELGPFYGRLGAEGFEFEISFSLNSKNSVEPSLILTSILRQQFRDPWSCWQCTFRTTRLPKN